MRCILNSFTWLLPLLLALVFSASIAHAFNFGAHDSTINTVTGDGSAQIATVIEGKYLGLPEQDPQTPAELAEAGALGEAPLPSPECRAALAANDVQEGVLEHLCP